MLVTGACPRSRHAADPAFRSHATAMNDKICQRAVFRIRYPDEARPQLTAFARDFEIVDFSEAGMRVCLNGAPPPASQSIKGQIRFATGGTAEISGFVVRSNDGCVAVKFAKSLSPALIMNEQRWLRDYAAKQRATAANPAAK